MRTSLWALSAVLLLSDAACAKAISLSSRALRRIDNNGEFLRRSVSSFESVTERRSAASQPDSTMNTNTTVAGACTSAVSGMNVVSNSAGYAGCYNILAWDPETTNFQADLRIYQHNPASGNFANISASQITVLLTYPESTQFKSLVKRGSSDVVARDETIVQIQQFTLSGNLKQPFDASRLNLTSLASLMVPQISLQAKQPSSSQPMVTNMTATDSVWFVAGQFMNISSQAAEVVNPTTAAAAVIAARGFELPGQTFGIFPTGLIITSVWTVLFLFAFGVGTIGRIKSRNVYRRRMTTLAAHGRGRI